MEQRYNRCPYKQFYRVRDQENTARGPVYVTTYICDIIQAPSFVCRRRHSGSFDIHPGGHRCGQVLREFPVHTTSMLVCCCPVYKPAGAVHICPDSSTVGKLRDNCSPKLPRPIRWSVIRRLSHRVSKTFISTVYLDS